ncbi:hypothetical protein L202_02628 [Cryptococcus amylolentus CBS 6039]|uniref:Adenylate kinase active site lid domain-containing protein n=1 Tax=Cryptococcus amylolentus CBS 6039 TaxID=1295533 RepID=A0A1E3HVM1_9TREE|nr:hypothetical protein L202_02628 [Cryptococcus amylolentus CBS 6039]ODN80373.1 hypothetical protein L202_02628 [Cryptococcus amylolentus CBS 6039]
MALLRPRTAPRALALPRTYRPISRFNHSSASTSATSQVASAVSDTVASLRNSFRQATEFLHSPLYDGAEEKGLRMLVFGKPGSGKGTLSSRLIEHYDIAFVSTGDVLRKEIAAKSEMGKKAEAIVASGGLVSDELMLEIVKAELDRLKGKSFILDGFPRTLHQGQLLDNVLNQENRPLNMVVHLNVPDSVIMARIAARWVHLPSGRVYNTTYSAPKIPGKDDVTGEPLTKRPDDTPETFSKRLRAYYESTAPLLEYFEENYPESLHSISGSSSDEVLSAPATSAFTSQASRSDAASSASAFSSPTTIISASSSSPFSPSSSSSSDAGDECPIETSKQNAALDKLWPQLVDLIEPFKLERKTAAAVPGAEGLEKVRSAADDLRDDREEGVGRAEKV